MIIILSFILLNIILHFLCSLFVSSVLFILFLLTAEFITFKNRGFLLEFNLVNMEENFFLIEIFFGLIILFNSVLLYSLAILLFLFEELSLSNEAFGVFILLLFISVFLFF